MKVLLYFEGERLLSKSGIGRALKHQQMALTLMGIEYTTDETCEDYDILHINTYGINSSSMIRKARKLNKKVIYHAHSTEEDFKNSFILSNQIAPFLREHLIKLYSSADYIITPTPYSKLLLENYGIDVPIVTISNGIDLNRFHRDIDKEEMFRKYFSIKEDEKVIICVGLYFERKGIFDFVEVARLLPNYRFIWFGYTPLISVPKAIKDLVREDHPSNVEFAGYIKGDVIEGAFSGADVFFFPSLEETEGIVVLEALASHQNVIVRDIPVYEGWLEDKVNCYMGTSPDMFVSLIEGVIQETLPSTKEAAYAQAQTKSIAKIGIELKSIYEKVLEGVNNK